MSTTKRRVLTDAERLDWLRLIRTENVGPRIFRHVLQRFGSAAAALAALPTLSRRGGRLSGIAVCSREAAEREFDALAAVGARLIAFIEADYPPALSPIDDAPPLISVIGDASLLLKPAIAVVGSRNASLNGRRLAASLARDLGAAGVVVVSGLARGIDAAAHSAALETGTVAVLAGGVDVVYPEENRELYTKVARAGVLVSEIAPGVHPQARHFPQRNRVISGLSLGVIVVEAAVRSGALITTRFALEQGREVFAVPGSPLDPRSRGANGLIRQGAVLVEEADHVLQCLQPTFEPRAPVVVEEHSGPRRSEVVGDSGLDDAREAIVRALSPAPATVDEVIRSCQLSPAVVTTVLLEWELAGRLERHPGNRVALVMGPAP